MAVLIVPNTIEITAYGTIAGKPWASVWGMTNGAGLGTGAEVEEVVRDFADNWQDHLMSRLSNNVVLQGFRYLSLNSADGQTGAIAPTAGKPTTGSAGLDSAPPNVCYLVRKNADGGRGARSGRAYLPGVSEGNVASDGSIGSTVRGEINAKLQAFLDGISDQGTDGQADRYPCVIRRPEAAREKGPQIVNGSQGRITSLQVDGMVATQRRRLRG